jgi:5-formyltetrahydrofolate cyclo-ligase
MKKDIRASILSRRNSMSRSEIDKKSFLIKEQLFGLEGFQEARSILFYVSYGSEVATHEMIRECLASKKKVVVPCTDTKNRQISLSELRGWDDLGVGAYHIQEPRVECRCEVPFDAVDLIVVPGIAFDCAGHRIGHGMGYYDRLLSASTNAMKIGVAFELQLVEKIPAEHHDVSVDMIITEKRMIHTKKFLD